MQKSIFMALAFVLSATLFFTGCKKEEGEGGTAIITGKVILHDYDFSYQFLDSTGIKALADEKVFIIYGADGSIYDDDFTTTFDGSYEFKNLQKGKYRLFAYSKDSTGAYNGTLNPNAPDVPSFLEVEIKENGETVNAPDLVIINNNN